MLCRARYADYARLPRPPSIIAVQHVWHRLTRENLADLFRIISGRSGAKVEHENALYMRSTEIRAGHFVGYLRACEAAAGCGIKNRGCHLAVTTPATYGSLHHSGVCQHDAFTRPALKTPLLACDITSLTEVSLGERLTDPKVSIMSS